MFSPSPCPSHYAGRWATMASADFCLINQRVAPAVAVHNCWAAIGSSLRSVDSKLAEWDLITRESDRDLPNRNTLHFKQISPDKNMNFHSTTASFTVSTEPGASLSCANLPMDSALYDVSVRRLTVFAKGFLPTKPRGFAVAFR